MKKAIYKPKDDSFTGQVEIILPSARQRLRYIKECGFVADGGEMTSASNMDAMESMYQITAKHVSKITLKRVGGTVYKSFDKMTEDAYCDEICDELVKVVLEGKLGEA
jgi:hypothetical protein